MECMLPHHGYGLPLVLVISQHSSCSSACLPNCPNAPATFSGGVAHVAVKISVGDGSDVVGSQVVLGGNGGCHWGPVTWCCWACH